MKLLQEMHILDTETRTRNIVLCVFAHTIMTDNVISWANFERPAKAPSNLCHPPPETHFSILDMDISILHFLIQLPSKGPHILPLHAVANYSDTIPSGPSATIVAFQSQHPMYFIHYCPSDVPSDLHKCLRDQGIAALIQNLPLPYKRRLLQEGFFIRKRYQTLCS